MTNISTAADLRQKLESRRYGYFTFPILDITIKYRKPDLIKLSLNNSLPQFLAEQVIGAYKAQVEGRAEEFQAGLAERKIDVDDELLRQLHDKGYNLLSELCISHKIMDVRESDPENNLIAWVDIPEGDAMAFVLNMIQAAQVSQTETGGEVSLEDTVTFPDAERGRKRRPAGANV